VELDLDKPLLSVCRLGADESIPGWLDAAPSSFLSVTRTRDELSIVVPTDAVPQGVQAQPDWRALSVRGPLEFSLIGVLASLLTPLAEAQVPIFVISTFDTDRLLVPSTHLEDAIAALERAGHRVHHPDPG
jgi:uncharacterized protein